MEDLLLYKNLTYTITFLSFIDLLCYVWKLLSSKFDLYTIALIKYIIKIIRIKNKK